LHGNNNTVFCYLNMGKKILFCNCSSERIKPERLESIKGNLIKSNVDLISIQDLCGMSVHNKESIKSIFNKEDDYLIIGCHTRAMKLLLENTGIETQDHSIRFINFLDSDNEEILRETEFFNDSNDLLEKDSPIRNQLPIAIGTEIRNTNGWIPWYPVIDYSRCTSCGQCADFCLFGVYEKSDGKIKVINPEGCKNNCPACARICPQTAIIFPKYNLGGAIGGSDVIDEISEQKRQAEDINTLLNGDIYSALEQRKIKRRSIIREEAMNKAIEERLNALKNNKQI
jgi:NAD-dependent dihydropyrimidine dehydrogenase PreA subunit